jgi:hypothetical protein
VFELFGKGKLEHEKSCFTFIGIDLAARRRRIGNSSGHGQGKRVEPCKSFPVRKKSSSAPQTSPASSYEARTEALSKPSTRLSEREEHWFKSLLVGAELS